MEEIESYDSATFSAYKYSYDQACDVFQIKDSKGKEEEGDKHGSDTKMSVYAESSSNNDGNGEDGIKISKTQESLNPVEIDLKEDHDAMEVTEINNLNEQEVELRKVKEENDFIQRKEEKEKNDAAEDEAAQGKKIRCYFRTLDGESFSIFLLHMSNFLRNLYLKLNFFLSLFFFFFRYTMPCFLILWGSTFISYFLSSLFKNTAHAL